MLNICQAPPNNQKLSVINYFLQLHSLLMAPCNLSLRFLEAPIFASSGCSGGGSLGDVRPAPCQRGWPQPLLPTGHALRALQWTVLAKGVNLNARSRSCPMHELLSHDPDLDSTHTGLVLDGNRVKVRELTSSSWSHDQHLNLSPPDRSEH